MLPKEDSPPGAACTRVDDLSVRTFPLLGLALEAKLFDVVVRLPPSADEGPPRIPPKEDSPPGAACTRVDGRSVRTFPEFGLAPEAKLLEVVVPTCSVAP
mmetsp:Transcript_122528/g.194085  ORF Transcript_122528/g.194085 Transcript_122528/m.194085 type:complete len:100 (+) Transcript_122528:305-604(+)